MSNVRRQAGWGAVRSIVPFLLKLAKLFCAVVVVRCAWAFSGVAVEVLTGLAYGPVHIWEAAPGVVPMLMWAWVAERRATRRDDRGIEREAEREQRAVQREADRDARMQNRLM